MADVNPVSIIVDSGDESNLVACDIKHCEFPKLDRRAERLREGARNSETDSFA